MKKYIKPVIGVSVLIFSTNFYSCQNASKQKKLTEIDTALSKPDGFGGTYLTHFGALVYGPVELIDEPGGGYNSKIYIGDSEISSKPIPYNLIQKDLVFNLLQNGKMAFWLKSEIGNTKDTIRDGSTITIVDKPFTKEQFAKIYLKGFWRFNAFDSSVYINFEDNRIPNFDMKCEKFGSTDLAFQKISISDSIINGKHSTLKKKDSFYYHRVSTPTMKL